MRARDAVDEARARQVAADEAAGAGVTAARCMSPSQSPIMAIYRVLSHKPKQMLRPPKSGYDACGTASPPACYHLKCGIYPDLAYELSK